LLECLIQKHTSKAARRNLPLEYFLEYYLETPQRANPQGFKLFQFIPDSEDQKYSKGVPFT